MSRFRFLLLMLVVAPLLACSLSPGTALMQDESTAEPDSGGNFIGSVINSDFITNTPRPDTTVEATEEPDDSAATPQSTPTPAPIAGAIGPVDFPLNVNALTGETVPDMTTLARRPIVAKLSNAPAIVRPQAGLGDADLVFEHYAEGGLTRFSAIFYGTMPERAGSIRSARLIDYELMPMYRGLLAYSGASIGVEDYLNTSEFVERLYKGVLYGRPYYWRDESIPVPHNMFFNAQAITQLAFDEGVNGRPELEGMAFHPDAPPGAISPANAIDIRYIATTVRWEYDPALGAYRRWTDGEPHGDANTGEQVAFENVVVIFAEHRFTDIIESQFQDSVSFSIEMQLWFDGDAILFRDGQRYDGRWVRPTREDMLGLRTNDGELLYFKPGSTFFQVFRPPNQQDPAEESIAVE